MANPGPGWFRSIDAKCTKASRASLKRPASNKSVPRCHQPSDRSEEHTSELQSRLHLVCRLLLEKKNTNAQRATRLNVHLSCTTSDRSISMRTTITRTCNEHSIPLRHEPITTYKYRRRSACTHVS